MTIVFFFFFEGVGWGGGRKKKQMKWQKKWSCLKPNIRKRVLFGWNAGYTKNFEINPPTPPSLTHTPSSLRFWTREDVICHIWKVGEEERHCSPFRDAAILSLERNVSSRAHYYISPPWYWKQHVPSVSLCLSCRAIIKQIILRVANLKSDAGIPFVNIHTVSADVSGC